MPELRQCRPVAAVLSRRGCEHDAYPCAFSGRRAQQGGRHEEREGPCPRRVSAQAQRGSLMIDIDRRAFIAYLGGAAAVAGKTPDARADALENYLAASLAAGASATAATVRAPTVAELEAQIPTRNYRRGVGNGMVNKDGGNVTLLPPLPARPTLTDFIRLR